MKVIWTKITREIYMAIFNRYDKELCVYSSFTNPETCSRFGSPRMETEWCFKDEEVPLIKSSAKKESDEQEWVYEYFIAKIVDDED